MSLCPACGEPGVPPHGGKDSKILIIGEFPGDEEMEKGRPFIGPTGKVFKAELRRVGIEYALCRVTNIWLHPPTKNEFCLKAGIDIALDEAKGKQAILLVGSECARLFLDKGVMEVSGLQVESQMLSAPIIFAMPNPALVFQPNRGVGEIRFALKNFADACEKAGLLDDDND